MPVKKFRPQTPSLRFTALSSFEELTASKPESSLVERHRSTAGRNQAGRITVRHRGGGHKRRYRRIDFRRDKHNVPAKVATVEYDPNRSSNIALLNYADGEKRYIVAPLGLKVGKTVMSGPNAEPANGNALPLSKIPIGMPIHNIELEPGRGGKLARGAGTGAQIQSREGQYANIKLPSGEVRMISVDCYATVGQVGNVDHQNISMGKAGRARWKGRRPTVRGVAMNPVDHPMGGGEGRTSGGGHPCSPWGQLSKGGKTRARKSRSNKFIVQRRKK